MSRKQIAFIFVFVIFILPMGAGPILQCDFEQWGHGWYTPPYYGGKTSFRKDKNFARNGVGFLHVRASESGGKIYGRAIIHPKLDFWAGKIIRMQGYVKGTGIFFPGFAFTVRKNGKNESEVEYAENALNLTDEYQLFTLVLNLSGRTPFDCTPRLELRGAGEVYVDDLVIEELRPEKPVLTAPSAPAPLRGGEFLPKLDFQCSEPGRMVRFFRLAPDGELLAEELIISDRNGLLNYLPTETAGSESIGTNQIIAAIDGATVCVRFEVKAK